MGWRLFSRNRGQIGALPVELPSADTEETAVIFGYCDGVRGRYIHGWAWRPGSPDEPVEIDLFIDGALVATTEAKLYRPDLRLMGVGHGCYGWRIPFEHKHESNRPLQIVALSREGIPLKNGSFEHCGAPSAADLADAKLQSFVAAGLNLTSTTFSAQLGMLAPVTHFLIYKGDADNRLPGAAENEIDTLCEALIPTLEQLGNVHFLNDHTDGLKNELFKLESGKNKLILSFAPLHKTPIDFPIPVIPVVSWGFPNIPDRPWEDEAGNDWRFVLRQMGRAIAVSQHALETVKSAMGEYFPVAKVAIPVWDRMPKLHHLGSPRSLTQAVIEGSVFDSYDRKPHSSTDLARLTDETNTSSSVVFTAIVAPTESRHPWGEILTAFFAAHRDEPNVTLILKMVCKDAMLWQREFEEVVQRQPPFACRVIALGGLLEATQVQNLIAVTHWYVNVSRHESCCLNVLQFMCAGRPALAPVHTALSDYLSEHNSLTIETTEEFCSWPHDPTHLLGTTQHRLAWTTLVSAFVEAFEIVEKDPRRYQTLAIAAQETVRSRCTDDEVKKRLDSFLGLGAGFGHVAECPSALLRTVASAA